MSWRDDFIEGAADAYRGLYRDLRDATAELVAWGAIIASFAMLFAPVPLATYYLTGSLLPTTVTGGATLIGILAVWGLGVVVPVLNGVDRAFFSEEDETE